MNVANEFARPAGVLPRGECPVCSNKPGISIVASHTCPQYRKIPDPEKTFEFFLNTLSSEDQAAYRRMEERSVALRAARGALDVPSPVMQQRGIARQQILTEMREILDKVALPPQG